MFSVHLVFKGTFSCVKIWCELMRNIKNDKLWNTCCELNNLLLDVDGLSNRW